MAFFGRTPAPPPLSRLDELKKTLQKEPGSRQFLALAEEFRKEGEYAEAVRALENGLRYHPAYVAAHVSLGRVLREIGRPDEALKAFLNALKIDGENLVAIKQAGMLYAEKGERVEAVKKFKRYRGLNPGDKEVAEQIERLDLELGTTTRLRQAAQMAEAASPQREPAASPAFPPPIPRPVPGRVPERVAEPSPTQPLPRVAVPSLEVTYEALPRRTAEVAPAERPVPPAPAEPESFLFDVEVERGEEPSVAGRDDVEEDGDRTRPWGRAPGRSDVLLDAFSSPPPSLAPAAAPGGEPRRGTVTETLADLYLAQGLRDEARRAYEEMARTEADPARAAAFRERAVAIAMGDDAVRPADGRRQRLEAYLGRIGRPAEGPTDLDPIVQELVDAGIGIESAIVTETGGVPLVTAGRFGPAEESLAAELADFWKNLKRGSGDLESGPPALLSLVADGGGAAVSGIGDGYALVLRIAAGASPGRIRYRAVRATSRLRPLLA